MFRLRERRPRFGELIQIDGSPHDWFEGRGERCTLIVFIDDATGRLTALQFAPVESTKANQLALRSHVRAHGTPLAFYSDRHGIFRVNACVKTKDAGVALRGARVTLHHLIGGALLVTCKTRSLDVTAVRKLPHPQPAEDEKTIDARVNSIISISAQRQKTTTAHGYG